MKYLSIIVFLLFLSCHQKQEETQVQKTERNNNFISVTIAYYPAWTPSTPPNNIKYLLKIKNDSIVTYSNIEYLIDNNNDSILTPIATEVSAIRLTEEQLQHIKDLASVIQQNVTPVEEKQDENEVCCGCMGCSLYINGINYYRDLGLPDESYFNELDSLIEYLNEISPIPIVFSSVSWG